MIPIEAGTAEHGDIFVYPSPGNLGGSSLFSSLCSVSIALKSYKEKGWPQIPVPIEVRDRAMIVWMVLG
jgi:hypothetical protein